MDKIEYLLYIEIIFIFLLFLIELFKKNLDYFYMEIVTHPKLNKNLYICSNLKVDC